MRPIILTQVVIIDKNSADIIMPRQNLPKLKRRLPKEFF